MIICQLKLNICVRCDMGFIEPMHRNKPNITYLLINDQSISVQVMAWCRQATSHYLSQCWLSSMSPDPNELTFVYWIWFRKHRNAFAFLSIFSIEIVQVIEILPLGRQLPFYPVYSIPLLLMTWWHKQPGHPQQWYWSSSTRIFHIQPEKNRPPSKPQFYKNIARLTVHTISIG